MHTANLILRFMLELAALAGFSALAWRMTEGHWRYLAVVVVVLLIGAIWAAFAVPGDPSRSGSAPVPTPGGLRLLLEFAILFGGACAAHAAGYSAAGLALAALFVLHYVMWFERIDWLLEL